jgi:hypothetical protein
MRPVAGDSRDQDRAISSILFLCAPRFETDPRLVEAFARDLASRVTGKLTNAELSIWRDKYQLRSGNLWDERICEAVRLSAVLIVLLTPKWIESEYCRKEYQLFVEEVESNYGAGEYVLVILGKEFENQSRHFDNAQSDVVAGLNKRQYKRANDAAFLRRNPDRRVLLIDEVADDLAGMVERLRGISGQATARTKIDIRRRPSDAESLAHNLSDVDIFAGAEVVIRPPVGNNARPVLAYVAFIERLYVKTEQIRVVFGVQRCFLSIDDGGTGKLLPLENLRIAGRGTMSYVPYRHAQTALTVCVTAAAGSTLGALPMTVAEGENYLSNVALLKSDAQVSDLKAEISISLSTEGLWIEGAEGRISPRTTRKLEVITNILIERDQNAETRGRITRPVPIYERDR